MRDAPGLDPVLHSDQVTIYEVPDPTELLTGPADACVTELTHDSLAGTVAARGTYRLRLNWSPHWEVVEGDVTVHESTADGKVTLGR